VSVSWLYGRDSSSYEAAFPRRKPMIYRPPATKLFVALAGNIGAGKSTGAKLISETFGFELYEEPVIDNRFLAGYYADMRRWSFTLQLEFLIKRVQHHELITRAEASCVQDRTLLEDPEVFAKYLHGLGHMEDRELDLYFEYFHRLHSDLQKPDKVIHFHVADTDTLLDRIRARGREAERSISEKFLGGLNAYYSALPTICEEKYGLEVLSIDVGEIDIRTGEGREALLGRVHDFLHH
jgi:deoxyadenosine/deoxycytidine kinase